MPKSYTARKEIIEAEWHSGLLQVNDVLIQLPIRLSELAELGIGFEVDMRNKTNEYLFTKGDRIAYDLTVNGTAFCHQSYTCEEDGFFTLAELNPVVDYINVYGEMPEDIKFFLPGGLTLGESLANIEEKLGEPLAVNANNNMVYQYGSVSRTKDEPSFGMEISVDRNTQLVNAFVAAKNISACTREDISTVTFENINNLQSQDYHNLQLLFPKEYYSGGEGTLLHTYYAILEEDGEFYRVDVGYKATLLKYLSQYEYNDLGAPIYDVTDENGVIRRIYRQGNSYTIVCINGPFVMDLDVRFSDMSVTPEIAGDLFYDFVMEMGSTVQY